MPLAGIALFCTLFLMALIWFGLILWVFGRLRSRHPLVFESLGSPSLFWHSSPRNNLRFFRFLFSAEPSGLQDEKLARVCILMRYFFFVYTLLFLVLIIAFVKFK
jgi:hypothetical protein